MYGVCPDNGITEFAEVRTTDDCVFFAPQLVEQSSPTSHIVNSELLSEGKASELGVTIETSQTK